MRSIVLLLVICTSAVYGRRSHWRTLSRGPHFLRDLSTESKQEYRDLRTRFDLSSKEKMVKILEWAEKNGIKESVQKYSEEAQKRKEKQRETFKKLIANLPAVSEKYLTIADNTDKTMAQIMAEMDKLKSENKKEYQVITFAMKVAKPSYRRHQQKQKDEKNNEQRHHSDGQKEAKKEA